ncbi:MAG TPA: hypothetical protein VLY23_10000 [Candidatus Acidoferrum sp.]|nr:hypothetical protein [Candidatus Acidoferrum sp.]
MTDLLPAEDRTHRQSGHPALVTGLYTGTLLIIVMMGALVAANRIPGLETYALERNAASYSLFVLFMLIPVFRFLNNPLSLFASAMIGWLMFVVAYDIAGMVFKDLFDVLRTPFQALIEGAVIYGVIAVGSWVGGMVLFARRHPIAPRRRRTSETPSDQR